MKNLINISFFVFYFSNILSAQDTIYRKNQASIVSKVVEISPTEIKYKTWDNLEGPNFVIYATDVYKIKFQNGTETVITPDSYAANQESQIVNKAQALKFSVFSPLNNNICFSYEKMLKVGVNIEAKIAYIGIGYKEIQNVNVQGSYAKIGAKFLLGQDFYINGMRYIHPLKGRYIKIEAAYSYYKIWDVEFSKHLQQQNPNNGYYYGNTVIDRTDISMNSGAFNIIYGRQFILGNLLTLDYFVGLGYGATSGKASNPAYSFLRNSQFNSSKYGFFNYNSKLPVAFSAGLNIGYIF